MLGYHWIPIPNWLEIPLYVIFIPVLLYNGEILIALAFLLMLVHSIRESFSGEEENLENQTPLLLLVCVLLFFVGYYW